MHDVLTRAVRL